MIFIIVCNATFLSLYFLLEKFSFSPIIISSYIGGLIIIALGLASLNKNHPVAKIFVNFQLSLFIFSILCILLDVFFYFSPGVFPVTIRNLKDTASIEELRQQVVEYLPYSPYAKLKPNVSVKVPGYYGPDTDFVYEWKTDSRGFKNMANVAQLDQVHIVAVGDSFTEGLGVRTEDTWSSLLTKKGLVTYSLGVQGYAPTQMAGAYDHYGVPLKPNWVVIGYLGGVYQREAFFLKNEEQIINEKKFPSAIGRLVDQDITTARSREIKKQYKFVITAVMAFMRWQWSGGLKGGVANPDEDARFMSESELKPNELIRIGAMQRYRNEIFSVRQVKQSSAKLENEPEWKQTLTKFSNIINEAHSTGAKVVIVMFRFRGGMYYEKATGQQVPSDYLENIEKSHLEEFCKKNGVMFLDTAIKNRPYVAKLDESTPISEYPYLRYDGHPSPKGHEIIAEQLVEFFQAQKNHSKTSNN